MEYGYSNDRLTRITHNGFNYGFGYDEFGKTRLVAVAGSSIVSYEYEENNGELLKTKYANGDYLRCEYDTQGRLVKEYYYSAASQKEQLLHYYVYDREGNLYRATDYASGKTYRMSYDFLDRLMRVRDEKGNAYQYTYDANNNMIRLRHEADGMNRTSAYTYDKDSREIKTTLGAITRNTAYDAWGRVKTQDWKDGENQIFRVSYEYPDSGKNIISLPTAVVNGGSRTEYTYDNNGNITSIKEGGKTVTYTYDGMNRLTRENNELLNKTITYYYDEGGNLREEREYDYTTEALSGSPKKLTTAVMDEKWKDKLLKWGSTQMTYDACGNMLKKGNTSFTWTQGRKLSEISNGKSIRYYYDHTGARVKKVVDGVSTEYRMAGSLIVSERTGDETIWYQYDSAARLVAMVVGGVRYNYVRNAQNDIIGLIDKIGKRVVSYKYDSWGKTISTTGTLAATIGKKNPFRYRGYYFDAESGMYYLQSRYYDVEIRRFISADDVDVLDADEEFYYKNLYAYCDSNSVCRIDEAGNLWELAIAGGGVFSIGVDGLLATVVGMVAPVAIVVVAVAVVGIASEIAYSKAKSRYKNKVEKGKEKANPEVENKERSPYPPAERNTYNTRKGAKEAAQREVRRRRRNEELRNDKHQNCRNTRPHFHAGESHNHYYYPRHFY